jgi:hypothetical protein
MKAKYITFVFLSLILFSCANLREENNNLKVSLAKLKESNEWLNEKLKHFENQNDSLVIVSFERQKTLYAGYPNIITIKAPYSDEVIVESESLKKLNDNDTYVISPELNSKNHEIRVFVKTKKGDWIETKYVYNVKSVGGFAASIDSKYDQIYMTKEKLASSLIEVYSIDSCFDLELSVLNFKLKCPNQKAVSVSGNKFSQDALEQINNTEIGDVVMVTDVLCHSGFLNRGVEVRNPLVITIIK